MFYDRLKRHVPTNTKEREIDTHTHTHNTRADASISQCT